MYMVRCGFDYIAAPSDLLLGGDWVTANNWTLTTRTRFGYGKALQSASFANGQLVSKLCPNSTNTVYCALEHLDTDTIGGTGRMITMKFRDLTTVQCSIVFKQDGSIVVYSGNPDGTGSSVVATFPNAFLPQFNQWQAKVILSPTAGEVHIRANGSSTDTFSATGINTQAGANNYCNTYEVYDSDQQSNIIDNVAFWDSSGAEWNTWIGDPRVALAFPNADTAQKQFTASNTGTTTFGSTSTGSTETVAANTLTFVSLPIATAGGTLGALSVNLSAGFTGNMSAAIYEGGGQPTTTTAAPLRLVATCSTITNPVTGVNNFTWTSTPTVRPNKQYFVCLWSDTAFTVVKGGSNNQVKWAAVSTFTGTFPNIPPVNVSNTSTNQLPYNVSATITPTNSGMVSDYSEDGSLTMVQDGTVGDYDLYGISSLPTTATSILGVTFVAMIQKSDAGGRGYATTLKSGSTNYDLPTHTPNTTWNYVLDYQDTDPNTLAAWLPSAIAALEMGPKTAS